MRMLSGSLARRGTGKSPTEAAVITTPSPTKARATMMIRMTVVATIRVALHPSQARVKDPERAVIQAARDLNHPSPPVVEREAVLEVMTVVEREVVPLRKAVARKDRVEKVVVPRVEKVVVPRVEKVVDPPVEKVVDPPVEKVVDPPVEKAATPAAKAVRAAARVTESRN